MELTQIGKYKIVAKIGQGAMGVVYRAQDPVLHREVAIKTITASLGADEQFRKRFQREAQSAAGLNHPNIVTVYDFGQEKDKLYMAMELLAGTDLKELIRGHAVSRLDDKLSIVEQMLSGLAFAHAKGVIHRDLKPANIHVLHDKNKTVKILDFGLARLGVSEMTRTGTVMGTPNYMSPEQVRAEPVDGRSDLFSVGAVMYELLAGRKPFDAESMHAILFEVLERDPRPLTVIAPSVPPIVLPIVSKALAKHPDGRYQSAIEMRDAIRSARRALASAQAAAAALVAPGDPEATHINVETPTILEPSPPSLPPMSGYRTPSVSVPPTAGATALSLAAARGDVSLPRTMRPDPTLAAEATVLTPLASEPKGRGALLGAAAALTAVVVGVVAWQFVPHAGPVAPRADLTREKEGALLGALVASQVELARAEIQDKDWEGAAKRAEGVLKLDAGNGDAKEILARARETLSSLEAAATEAKAAFDRGDTDAASQALGRVLAIDPRHPVVGQLSAALNRYFTEQVEQARKVADGARREAEKAHAGSNEAFRAADRLVQDAQELLTRQQFAGATQKFLEAGDSFGKARRAAETAAAVAAAASASARLVAASSAPSAAPERVLPPATASAPLMPAASAVPVVSPPSAGALQSPPLPPPVVSPGASNTPALPALPPTTPNPASSAAQGVRKVIADYGRAMETRDLELLKSVKPLSGDEEKRLREAFKAGQPQKVVLTIDSVDVNGTGTKAVARASRQDTVNGRTMKPVQQTFGLVLKDGSWIIDSIGQ